MIVAHNMTRQNGSGRILIWVEEMNWKKEHPASRDPTLRWERYSGMVGAPPPMTITKREPAGSLSEAMCGLLPVDSSVIEIGQKNKSGLTG
jgi:hypothetical protein